MEINCNLSSDDNDNELKMFDLPLYSDSDDSNEYICDYEYEIEPTIKHISFPWFNYLFEERKTWDIRLKKNYWSDLIVGQSILYYGVVDNCGKVCCMRIIDIKIFDDLIELLKKIPFRDIMPDIASEKDAMSLFRKWYSAEDEKKYGIIAVNLQKIY